MTPFQTAIRTARESAGMSRYALAKAVNERTETIVASGHAGQWEDGKRDPSPETICAIADVLDLNPAELCRLAGKIHPAIRAALNNPIYVQDAYEMALSVPHDAT